MQMIKTLMLLLLFPAASLTGQVTVWPGDASNNGECNHVDVLFMAMGYGTTGPARDTISSNWAGKTLNSIWPTSTTTGLNHGYFDANGDGFISEADTTVVSDNYFLTHGNLIPDPSSMTGNPSSPSLSLSFQTDSLTYSNDTTLVVDLTLGSPANQVQNVLGIAFTLTYDTTLVTQITPNISGGFLTQGNTLLYFYKSHGNSLDITIARSDRTGVSGSGLIGSISIVMDDNLRIASNAQFGMEVSQLTVLTPNGTIRPVNGSKDSISLNVLTNIALVQPQTTVSLGPVPADESVIVHSDQKLDAIRIYDLQGRLLNDLPVYNQKNQRIDTHSFPTGHYILELQGPSGVLRKKLEVRHSN